MLGKALAPRSILKNLENNREGLLILEPGELEQEIPGLQGLVTAYFGTVLH